MKRALLAVGMMLLSSTAMAEGFYLGMGAFDIDSNYCSTCDGDGWALEAGHQVNRWVAAEAKYGRGDLDKDGKAAFAYFGANLSPDVGPSWLKVYGKLGINWTRVDKTLLTGYDEDGLPFFEKRHSDVAFAYGAGLRLNVSNWYGRIEATRSRLDGEDFTNTILSFGLLF